MELLQKALAEVIERRTGLSLAEDMIERRLVPLVTRRAAALGLASLGAYVALLGRESTGGDEWRGVIAAVGNGQSSFFRDPEQFAAIRQLLAGRSRPDRPLWIWSAGCSTGEEPFSLAILCAELGLAGRARIVASDISGEFIERAREACFAPWTVRNVPADQLARWFEPASGGFRLRDEVRKLVDVRRHNLVAGEPLRPPEGGWQAILCRNVFIYFRRERVAEAVRRIASALAPDGWLALAAAETLRGLGISLEPHPIGGRVFYRPATAVSPSRFPGAAPRTAAGAPDRTGSELDDVVRLARSGRAREALDLLAADRGGGERTIAHHLARGHLHLRLHEIAAALAAYRSAAAIDALQCEVHFFEGVAQRKGGDWLAAADALRRALFLAPGLWQAAYLLAGAYQRIGRTREAERERRRAADLLRERAPHVVFLSHPVFIEWFSVDEDEARRALGIAR